MTMNQDEYPGNEDDVAYFRHRAAWHQMRADVADDTSTRILHQKFARLYLARSAGQPT
jgi:hypothetical protein